MDKEIMEYDVVIVGAGPSGLSAAIRLKQLCQKNNLSLSVCVLEKGAEVGAHILSGAVLEPRALNELLPDWKSLDAPLNTPVTHDTFSFLTESKAYTLPTPAPMKNHGNYIISLGNFCRWLAEQAVNAGVDLFPGFAAAEVLYDERNRVCGVITGDMGRDKSGNPLPQFQPGIEIHAKQTLFAEGCRGSLTQMLEKKYGLREESGPQNYAIGIKELWEVDPKHHKPGQVFHTIGWPMDANTYGGSFLYHLENNLVSLGFVVALDYENPYLNPYMELQRFKTHPSIKPLFENATRLSYGARALNEGGFQAIPELSFPGGVIMGDCAGFLNVPKIKGSHTAMKSGMVAAECVFNAFQQNQLEEPIAYKEALKKSWVWDELYNVRNIRPSFYKGLFAGLAYSALDTYILRGKAPWTFKLKEDYKQLKPAKECKEIIYPKPDGKITFDRLSSVFLTGTFHEENQPCHLKLKQPEKAIDINYEKYASPEQRYCPAGVYEIVHDDKGYPRLQINAQNCIHCKTCDIKDPTQNIQWVPPEGGGGPNYPNM